MGLQLHKRYIFQHSTHSCSPELKVINVAGSGRDCHVRLVNRIQAASRDRDVDPTAEMQSNLDNDKNIVM